MTDDRDIRIPKERAMTPAEGTPTWTEEPTGVHTDVQVFRAVKALGDEVKTLGTDLAKNKLEAANAHGALKQEVVSVNKRLDATDGKLDDMIAIVLPMSGKLDLIVADRRPRSTSSEMRMTVKETLADQVLADTREERQHRRALTLKILGGVIALLTSGAFIHYVLEKL